jgi:L-ascorbate metabolism protein UlaG (beta-lactamase superfamily)
MRVNPPGVEFGDLPRIDAVLLTHNHYDHLDAATLAALVDRDNPLIVTPLGNDVIVRRTVPKARFAVGDWDDAVTLQDGIRIHFEPAHHWSARGLGDRRMALWCAFAIETPAGKIYHVGDTGFHAGTNFRAVSAKHGPLKLAILPIGAYEPRWFMAPQHMNPHEAAQAFRICGAEYAVGHHWGTFQLTAEAIDAPRRALAAALKEQDIDPHRFAALQPGQSVSY